MQLKRSVPLGWPDSATSNRRPEMNFLETGSSKSISTQGGSPAMHGIAIWQKDRVGVVTALAAFEEVVPVSGGECHFESLGLRITAPKLWKRQGSIGMFSRDGFEMEIDRLQPYEFAPDEITGKES